MTHVDTFLPDNHYNTGGGFSRYCAIESCDTHYFTDAELDAGLDELVLNPLDNQCVALAEVGA